MTCTHMKTGEAYHSLVHDMKTEKNREALTLQYIFVFSITVFPCSLKTNFDSLKPPLDIEIQHFDWGKEASLLIQNITFLAQKLHDAGQVKGKLIDGCLQGLGC